MSPNPADPDRPTDPPVDGDPADRREEPVRAEPRVVPMLLYPELDEREEGRGKEPFTL